MTNRIKLSPLVGEIVARMETDIIFGRMRPNQEILEDTLMARFEAKRHVVRSAIQELVAMGLATKVRSRSARVKDFTPREVDEVYHMRALLQRNAAHIMPFPVSPQKLNVLKEIHVRYVAAVSVGADKYLIHTLNDEFHAQLFSLCSNTELCRAIHAYAERSNPIRSYGITDASWLDQAIEEHAAMIHAIQTQDRAALEQLVVDHMQPTRRRWEQAYAGPYEILATQALAPSRQTALDQASPGMVTGAG
ncbi:GntR family transcriptional regulator [Castellaniella sp.]|uniref:GntR family transcriptional regulator n=1 Tax=Castellaniella sp. TaxID=1955812 RepID=UPI00355FE279